MALFTNPPSVVEYETSKFVIFDAPTDSNIDTYIKEFKKQNVVLLVRACDPSYNTDEITKTGIVIEELPFEDGGCPSDAIISKWITLCNNVFKEEGKAIGVHCVAGLGRAPLLVCIALMELGMKFDEAIDLVRSKRKGAINAKQLKYLKAYKPKNGKKCSIC